MSNKSIFTLNFRKIFYNNTTFVLGFLSLSLSIFRIFEYSITLSFIITFYILYKYLSNLNKRVLNIYISFLIYLLLIAILFLGKLNFIEFLKSFLLTSIMLFVFIASLVKPLYYLESINLKSIIRYSSFFIILLEVLQVLEKLYFGTTDLWFLFDGISISTATNSGRFQAANFLSFIRPISFFHEPSYLGIVLLVLLVCSNQLQMKKKYFYFLIFGILLSFSTTALLFLILYLVILNIKKLSQFLFISFISFFFLITFLDWDTINNFIRINEILNSGTSGNVRLIGPFDYLYNQIFINNNYLGIPLGQSDMVFNNSFFLFFLYFGLLAPFIFCFFFIFIFNKYSYDGLYYLLIFFALLFLSGAIFTIEFAFILYFINLSFHEAFLKKRKKLQQFTNYKYMSGA